MNWLSNYIRPKIRSIVGSNRMFPKICGKNAHHAEGMLFHRDLAENLNVCNHCGHHMKNYHQRTSGLDLLMIPNMNDDLAVPSVSQDQLKFKDKKNMLIVLKMLSQNQRERCHCCGLWHGWW